MGDSCLPRSRRHSDDDSWSAVHHCGITARGARLVAVSPQIPDESLTLAEKHALAFAVLSDIGSDVAKQYGLAFDLPDDLAAVHDRPGFGLQRVNDGHPRTLPLPAIYVIDRSGTARWAFVDTDYTTPASGWHGSGACARLVPSTSSQRHGTPGCSRVTSEFGHPVQSPQAACVAVRPCGAAARRPAPYANRCRTCAFPVPQCRRGRTGRWRPAGPDGDRAAACRVLGAGTSMCAPTRCATGSGPCLRARQQCVPCLPEGLVVPEPLDAVTPAAAGTSASSAEMTAPPTVGVEEEFVLADRHSRAAVFRAPSVVGAARARLGAPHATAEVSQAQVETVSGVCRTAEDLVAEIVRLRGGAARAAAEYDCLLVPSGSAILGRPGPPPVADKARYRAFVRRFGPLVQDQGVNACHVHVGVADREEAVRAVNHLRGWMPLLLALTGNSPYSDGTDTGYASWRSMVWGRWPLAGPPPRLRGAAHFDQVVGHLVASGAAMDPAMVYWHVRPSPHLPTVEVRVADVLPDPAATTAYALLVRALVSCAVDAVRTGEPAPDVPDLLLRAACWQAARYGANGTLPATHSRDCAPTAVGRLVEELWKRVESYLGRYGDDRWVGDWLSEVQHRGTGSVRQRLVAEQHGGRLQAVVDELAVPPA